MVRRKKELTEGAPELTPLELELMRIFWERGSATASEISQALGEARPLADTTIHTVLANLRKKGYLEPVPTIERALRYAPAVPQGQVATRSLRQIMRDFFGGSPKRLLAHLISEENVDERELAELRKMLREKGAEGEGKQ